MIKPIVDERKCRGCGICLKVCPSNVFEIRGGKAYPSNANACIGCRMCETHCPNYAITLYFKA